MKEIKSPCIRNCCLDDQDVCLGCFRSLAEIIQWGTASNEDREKIIICARGRKIDYQLKHPLNFHSN